MHARGTPRKLVEKYRQTASRTKRRERLPGESPGERAQHLLPSQLLSTGGEVTPRTQVQTLTPAAPRRQVQTLIAVASRTQAQTLDVHSGPRRLWAAGLGAAGVLRNRGGIVKVSSHEARPCSHMEARVLCSSVTARQGLSSGFAWYACSGVVALVRHACPGRTALLQRVGLPEVRPFATSWKQTDGSAQPSHRCMHRAVSLPHGRPLPGGFSFVVRPYPAGGHGCCCVRARDCPTERQQQWACPAVHGVFGPPSSESHVDAGQI